MKCQNEYCDRKATDKIPGDIIMPRFCKEHHNFYMRERKKLLDWIESIVG